MGVNVVLIAKMFLSVSQRGGGLKCIMMMRGEWDNGRCYDFKFWWFLKFSDF